MGALRNIIIAVAILSFITFVALFGQIPALRKTPIGWLQWCLCTRTPRILRRIDQRTTGGRISARSKRLGQYLFYEQNPVVLILFLFLLTGSTLLFVPYAIPHLPTSLIIPIPIVVLLPYTFTFLCAYSRAAHITPSTHPRHIHDYPYDYTLFHPHNPCTTCALPKPARSKHCSLCGTCVAACDHHCPWINNCVGRGNYRYFLALLLSLGVMECYGAYLSFHILRPYLATDPSNGFFTQAYWDDRLRSVVVAINVGGLSIAGVGMLAAATFALPFGLLGYHCYLVWAGMTTNESSKWADLRDDMADGYVFKASRQALREHARGRKYDGADFRAEPGTVYLNGGGNPALQDWELEREVFVDWPVSSDQVIVRTRDQRPPVGQEALWTPVWNLKDVVNIYDLGGWDNFMRVLRGQ